MGTFFHYGVGIFLLLVLVCFLAMFVGIFIVGRLDKRFSEAWVVLTLKLMVGVLKEANELSITRD